MKRNPPLLGAFIDTEYGKWFIWVWRVRVEYRRHSRPALRLFWTYPA